MLAHQCQVGPASLDVPSEMHSRQWSSNCTGNTSFRSYSIQDTDQRATVYTWVLPYWMIRSLAGWSGCLILELVLDEHFGTVDNFLGFAGYAGLQIYDLSCG
jgi:hypothetical protein